MDTRRKVLLLNASGEALNMIPWTRALNLVLKGRVHVYEYFDGIEVHSATRTFRVPSVIALVKYIVIPGSRTVTLTKRNLLTRDGHQCAYCGHGLSAATATMDHVIPASKGGRKCWENVVVACKPCNAKKAHRTPEGADMRLRIRPWIPTRVLLLKERAEKEGYDKWQPYFQMA